VFSKGVILFQLKPNTIVEYIQQWTMSDMIKYNKLYNANSVNFQLISDLKPDSDFASRSGYFKAVRINVASKNNNPDIS
jgi:hypothetical protein